MRREFQVHELDEEGFIRARAIGALFDGLMAKMEDLICEGREMSIVRTKLEEACFFAKKAVALQHSKGERDA